MRIQLLMIMMSMLSCNQVSTQTKTADTPTPVVEEPLNTKEEVDSGKITIIKKDTVHVRPSKIISKNINKKEIQNREAEGITNDKLNGEPILLQLELSEKILSTHPDTIQGYLKLVYMSSESQFPRSIADNFEKGISTERIHYPKLNYLVQLFKDEYAKKTYQTFNYSIRKERDGNLIVE